MRRIFTAVSSALEFNSATLSGAIDVIVIQDENGGRLCSPFYVRFGKLQLLKSRGIPVDVVLNDVKTDLRMYLGAAGEAYFYDSSLADKLQTTAGDFPFSGQQSPKKSTSLTVQNEEEHSQALETDHSVSANSLNRDDDAPASSPVSPASVPEILENPTVPEAASPTNHSSMSIENSPSDEDDDSFHTRAIRSTSDLGFQNFAYMSDSEMELTRAERDGTVEVVDEPRSPPICDMQRRWTSHWARSRTMLRSRSMPAPDVTPGVVQASETHQAELKTSEEQSSTLFGLPEPEQQPSGNPQDPAGVEVAIYEESSSVAFVNGDSSSTFISTTLNDMQLEREEDLKLDVRSVDECSEREDLLGSEINEKLAKAFDAADESEGVIEMSLCGKLIQPGILENESIDVFNQHRVSRSDFEADPSVLYDDELLFRIEDRLVTFKIAAPFVMAMLAYQTPMDLDLLIDRMQLPTPTKPVAVSPTPSRRFGWFGWSSPTRAIGEPLLNEDETEAAELKEMQSTIPVSDVVEAKTVVESEEQTEENGTDELVSGVVEVSNREINVTAAFDVQNGESAGGHSVSFAVEELIEEDSPYGTVFAEADYDSECFSFLPNADQLQNLDLKPGPNEIRFVISSRSACELRCRVFLWPSDTKIVISDVDGTITRSDVLGHLLPGVGLDWSQVGVAGLYSQIAKNGYKMLYLTARPIGQASQTRDFLHSVTQGPAKLPNGPVLMSPNRLVESFTREVIRRKPHEFKIGCLRDVRCLFPLTHNPFHAGFGNRDTDVISYRAVGLIPQRIFVVNPRGELVVMKAMYESAASYSSLSSLVACVFPDISETPGSERIRHSTETSDWQYWRTPLPSLDLDALLQGLSTD